METGLLFFLMAAGMVGAVLAVMLPGVWCGALRWPSAPGARRSARQTTALLIVGLPAVVIAFFALRGDLAAVGNERSVPNGQLLDQGLPSDGAVAEQFYAALERHLQKHPRDCRALVFKARLDMRAERFDQAVATYEKASGWPIQSSQRPERVGGVRRSAWHGPGRHLGG